MSIEISEDKQIKGVNIQTPHKNISSYSHIKKQHDNEDDRLSMFADDSSTIKLLQTKSSMPEKIYTPMRKPHTQNYMKERPKLSN